MFISLRDLGRNVHCLWMSAFHRLDSGPIRLATIAHAFNYRVAVLRDGVKSAVLVKQRDGFWMIRTFHGDSRWLSCFR